MVSINSVIGEAAGAIRSVPCLNQSHWSASLAAEPSHGATHRPRPESDPRHPADGSAVAKGIGKQSYYAQIDLDQPKAYAYAIEVMASTSQLPHAKEQMQAFTEKRKPQFKGR